MPVLKESIWVYKSNFVDVKRYFLEPERSFVGKYLIFKVITEDMHGNHYSGGQELEILNVCWKNMMK